MRPRKLAWCRDLRTVRIVRLAVAVTIAMAISQAWPWPYSYIYVVLCVTLLSTPIPSPSPGETLQHMVYAIVVFTLIPGAVSFLFKFPIAFVVAYTVMVFLSAYYLHKGAPFLLLLFTYVALLVFPILVSVDDLLPFAAAKTLTFSALLALLTWQLATGLFPDPVQTEYPAKRTYEPGYAPEAARTALVTTILVVPAMLSFLVLQLAGAALVMVYIGMMSMGGTVAAGRKDASHKLLANAIGGLGAFAFYVVMIAVPQFHFFVVLMLLTSLLFANRIFSDAPSAQYYGTAFTGLVILVSSSMDAGESFNAAVIQRIVFIVIAGTYVIMAMSAVERFLARRFGQADG